MSETEVKKKDDGAADVIEKILKVLKNGENHEIEELAEKAGLTVEKTNRILQRLEDMKFIEAEEKNKIKITEHGKDFRNI